MMNERIRAALTAVNVEKGWETTEVSLVETLTDYCPVVYKETTGECRWWSEEFRVVRIADNLFVGYKWAVANRDESISDLGWEFDPASIREVEPVEVVTIRYRDVEE